MVFRLVAGKQYVWCDGNLSVKRENASEAVILLYFVVTCCRQAGNMIWWSRLRGLDFDIHNTWIYYDLCMEVGPIYILFLYLSFPCCNPIVYQLIFWLVACFKKKKTKTRDNNKKTVLLSKWLMSWWGFQTGSCKTVKGTAGFRFSCVLLVISQLRHQFLWSNYVGCFVWAFTHL